MLLLRKGEKWYPSGVDVLKAGNYPHDFPIYQFKTRYLNHRFDVTAISSIPRIVCETINSLELQDETPSWKIMDNKGRITVVLHWDHPHGGNNCSNERKIISSSSGGGGGGSSGGATILTGNGPTIERYSPSKKGLSAQNSIDKSMGSQRYPSPQITVINHDDIQSTMYHPGRRLSKQSGSFDSTVGGGAVHVHTPECAHHAHTPSRAGSPSAAECDFHCCALHEEGRKIAVHKSVATSPIQDAGGSSGSPQPTLPSTILTDSMQRRTPTVKGHVRFLDIQQQDRDSSESETENTVMEDETVTSEKFLLLIDQLSVDQKRHLNIKDIGIILERLSAKIIDVERLDRESESDDCYNWTIKATIRGEALRELGVIYNGNYYAISEHPGYKEENEELGEEEIEEDDEDRL